MQVFMQSRGRRMKMTYAKRLKVWVQVQGVGKWQVLYVKQQAKLCIWHGKHGVSFDRCAVCIGDYQVEV